MAKNMTIDVIDNSQKILQEFATKSEAVMNAIGAQCAGHTVDNCPVRTGLLRGSVTWNVVDDETVEIGFDANTFRKNGKEPYARYVELGTSRQKSQHMLQRAVQEHTSEYKTIALTKFKEN